MEQKYTSDTFLAKWLNKDLTEEERLAFEKTPAFKDYNKIIEKMDRFEEPIFDQKGVLEAIRKKTQSKQKVRRLIPNWVTTVAASIALLVGVFYFVDNDTVYETSYGEQMAIVLPDGSEVQLNAKSKITFDQKDWEQGTRNLQLDGEAYFAVQKGSKFTVKTISGNVSVLGTQFNVKRVNTYFEVRCFEGKVSVVNATDSEILTPGEGYRKIAKGAGENTLFEAIAPSWISGETSFNEIALSYVLEELERQYDVTIDTKKINVGQLFSGSFTNKNIKTALQTVCVPMGIGFEMKGKKTVILNQK